jgi:hypothetical protein
MAIAEQHERRYFIAVANIEAVTPTLEEHSGTTGDDTSIAEPKFLIVSHSVCQVDQFLILDGLKRRGDDTDDLTAVAADIGHMSLDWLTGVQGERNSIDTPAQIAFHFAAVDVCVLAEPAQGVTVGRGRLRDFSSDVDSRTSIGIIHELN